MKEHGTVSSRREFIRHASAAAAAALTAGAVPLDAQRATAMPTPRASALMAAFGVKYPIFAAGMGGPAGPDLAIAVANAGAVGGIGGGSTATPESVRDRVSRTRAGTKGLFAINYLLARADAVTVPAAVDAGAPIVQFAWGIPPADVVAAIRGARARMGIQVASVTGARRALDAGADYLICQGIEAGGHVQSSRALYDLLPAIVAEAKDLPVLAAGGIATGAHIRRALVAGASGVLIGTRFVATIEAVAHDEYKQSLARARATDTVMTVCFQDGWVNAPHRVLRNATLDMWEAAGCPPPGKRPGEGDVLTTNAVNGGTKRRYGASSPGPDDRGALQDLVHYAGQGVDAIRDVPSAADLVARLWKECLAARVG